MKAKPTEVRLVASLLDPTGESKEEAEDLASDIIEALETKRRKDNDYFVVVGQLARTAPVQTWGPFSTSNAAFKFMNQLPRVDKDEPGRATIARLEHHETFAARVDGK